MVDKPFRKVIAVGVAVTLSFAGPGVSIPQAAGVIMTRGKTTGTLMPTIPARALSTVPMHEEMQLPVNKAPPVLLTSLPFFTWAPAPSKLAVDPVRPILERVPESNPLEFADSVGPRTPDKGGRARNVAVFVTETKTSEIYSGDRNTFKLVMEKFKSIQQALAREGLPRDEVVHIEVDNLGNLPDKVREALAPSDRIKIMVLAGHGNSRQFAFSKGHYYSGAEAAKELSKPELVKKYLSEITFYFFACNAGFNTRDGFQEQFVNTLARNDLIRVGQTVIHSIAHPYFSSPWSLSQSRVLASLASLIHMTGFYRLFHAIRNRTGEFSFFMQGMPRGAVLLATLAALSVFGGSSTSAFAAAALPYVLLGHLFLTAFVEPLQFMTLRRISIRGDTRSTEDFYGSAISLFRQVLGGHPRQSDD